VVDRCMQTASPVVSNEAAADPLLGRRASVVTGGLRTLVCLPLMDGESVLGVVYADSRQPGALVTDLDLELLQAFTGRAALWIATHRDADSLRRLRLDARWSDIRAAHTAGAP
jgi:GAF domain-containing protein